MTEAVTMSTPTLELETPVMTIQIIKIMRELPVRKLTALVKKYVTIAGTLDDVSFHKK